MALFLVLLIITYILNRFILRIFVGKTLFLLFELDVAVSYIKLKLMHNLLKLTSIHHLNRQPNLLHVFQISKKKAFRYIRPTELLQQKPLTEVSL